MIDIKFDTRFLQSNKTFAVEMNYESDFVSINDSCDLIHGNPTLSTLSNYPAVYILAIYILSGSDYISNFFRITSDHIFSCFLKYAQHISPDNDPLVEFTSTNGQPWLSKLSVSAFTRLFCCAYLEKNSNIYSHLYKDVTDLRKAIQINAGGNLSPSLRALYELLQIDLKMGVDVNDLSQWTDLTRRACYFNNQGHTILFNSLLPSDSALSLKIKRGEFILRLILDEASVSNCYEDVGEGWLVDGDLIKIKWDEDQGKKRKAGSTRLNTVNSCQCSKCGVSGPGCKRCTKACLPCNKRCKCKGDCDNPHNAANIGYCHTCKPQTEQMHSLPVLDMEVTSHTFPTQQPPLEYEETECNTLDDEYSEDEYINTPPTLHSLSCDEFDSDSSCYEGD